MIAKSLFAAGAFASLVAAIPMAQAPYPKRDIVWETETEVAMTTIPVTVTHWLEPGETPPSDGGRGQNKHYAHGGKGHGHGGHQGPGYGGRPSHETSVAETVPTPTPEAPQPSSYEQPTSQYTAPASTTEKPPPAPETTQEAPAPPPVPETTPEVPSPSPVPETTQQAPPPAYTPPSSGGGSNSLSGAAASGKQYTGDLTWYETGVGACGVDSSSSEAVVAISQTLFDEYQTTGNPNENPLCGKSVKITGANGSPYTAKVVDRCTECKVQDLDLSQDLFNTVTDNGDGRVGGMSWTFV